MKVLITGCAGLLGSHFSKYLLNNEDDKYKLQLAEIYLLLGEPDKAQDLLENTDFKNHEDQNLLNLLFKLG